MLYSNPGRLPLSLRFFLISIFALLSITPSFASELEDKLREYYANDQYSGFEYGIKHRAALTKDWGASYVFGEMAYNLNRYEEAQSAFESVVSALAPELNLKRNIHEDVNATLHSNLNYKRSAFWAAQDLLGVIYYMQGRLRESLGALQSANDLIVQYPDVVEDNEDRAKHWYNYACASALNNKADQALNALEHSISLNASYARDAVYEDDLESIKKLPRFTEIVR